jgi:hypothetical protein
MHAALGYQNPDADIVKMTQVRDNGGYGSFT